jgi:hypothetical protein
VDSNTPRPRFTPGTHCTGGWVGPRAGLDTEARGKTLCPCRGPNPDRVVFETTFALLSLSSGFKGSMNAIHNLIWCQILSCEGLAGLEPSQPTRLKQTFEQKVSLHFCCASAFLLRYLCQKLQPESRTRNCTVFYNLLCLRNT